MAQGMSRTQKKKANEMQKEMLKPIAIDRQIARQYGEHIANYQIAAKFAEMGIISKEQLLDSSDFTMYMEVFYRLSKALPKAEIDNPDEINTSMLYEGQILKGGYKELCAILNEPIKTGKSKQLQEQKFLRYFDYEKLKFSNEIMILEIYPEPLPYPETKYKNSKFVNQLKILILCELLFCAKEDNDGNVFLQTTYRDLIKKLCLVSPYFYADINALTDYFAEKFASMNEYEEETKKNVTKKINKFKYDAQRGIKNSITYCLDRLQTDNLITFERYNMIVDMDGRYYRASPADEIFIQITKKNVANLLGCKNSQIASIYKPVEFNTLLQKKYNDNGWHHVYYVLSIGSNKKHLYKHIDEFTAIRNHKPIIELTEQEKSNYLQQYNDAFVNELLVASENKWEKQTRKAIDNLKDKNGDDLDDDFIIQLLRLDKMQENAIAQDKLLVNCLVKQHSDRNNEIEEFFSDMLNE